MAQPQASAAPTRPAGRNLTLWSFVCAGVTTLLPVTVIIFGIAALVLAVLGLRRGDRLARVALAVAVLAAAFGLITGGWIVLVDEVGLVDTGWGG